MRGGELARAGGVNVETLRYYERRALLAQPPRLASGYRKLAAPTGLRGSLERLLCECCHSQHAARECPALGKHAST